MDTLLEHRNRNRVSMGGIGQSGWKVSDLPGVRPQMLFPRFKPRASHFPFDAKGIGYFYFARNGIFALCKHWRLEGQEVLFPSYFHGVELEALLAAGVRPSFYPVTGDMRIDINGLIERITPETRAVYIIHYLGFPGPIEALQDICRERNLKLIEDCALALLSRHANRPLGSFGDAAVFCLYKTLPLPTGGALWLSGDEAPSATEPAPCRAAWSKLVSSLVQHYDRRGNVLARSALSAARALLKPAVRIAGTEWVGVGGQHFEIERAHLGMNRLNRILLGGQNFKEIVENRRRNYLILLRALSQLSKPLFRHLPVGVCPLFYPLLVPHDKEKLIVRLLARGITAVNFWRQSHPALPVGEFPEAERLRSTVLELPCHQDLNESDMVKIIEIVREEWALMRLNRSATTSVSGKGSLQENSLLSIAGRARAS